MVYEEPAILRMWPELSGCTTGYYWEDKKLAEHVIYLLSTCGKHTGRHHFAVVREGHGVVFSPEAAECLREANLLGAEE